MIKTPILVTCFLLISLGLFAQQGGNEYKLQKEIPVDGDAG
jgi:hypothetical protein